MIDEEKVKIAVAEFTKNPYWKKKYDEAPTELSRRHTSLGFYHSWFLGKISEEEKNEVIKERDKLKHQFGLAEWKYELKFCGHNPYHGVCVRKIKELEALET